MTSNQSSSEPKPKNPSGSKSDSEPNSYSEPKSEPKSDSASTPAPPPNFNNKTNGEDDVHDDDVLCSGRSFIHVDDKRRDESVDVNIQVISYDVPDVGEVRETWTQETSKVGDQKQTINKYHEVHINGVLVRKVRTDDGTVLQEDPLYKPYEFLKGSQNNDHKKH